MTMSDPFQDLDDNRRFDIVPYDAPFAKVHQEFAARNWPTKNRRRSEKYIRWKFRGQTSGPVNGFLLAVSDDEVFGQLGVIPVRLRAGDIDAPAQWACDLMVEPSLRRKGIGSLLFSAAIRRDCVTLGSDPSPAADITMARMGFQPLSSAWKMVLPLEWSHVLSWKLPSSLKFMLPVLSTMSKPIAWGLGRKLRCHTDVETAPWQNAVERIQYFQSYLRLPHIIHDQEFLNWRCNGLEGFSPRLNAICPVKHAYAIFEATRTYFFVYDWGAEDKADTLLLFSHIYQLAKQHRSKTILVLANREADKKTLSRLGFMTMRHPTKVIYYPTSVLFEKQTAFHYCLYDSDGNL